MGPSDRGITRRVAIVLAYTVVFWGLLPAGLWFAGRGVDELIGWQISPWWGGLLLAACGAWLLGWGIAELWRGGRGLPVSALPPPRFTARGPYRHVRHPIYLGFDLGVFGVGLAVGSPGLAFVVAPLLVPLWVIYALVEERGLRRRFGEAYRRYQNQVGLLPRFSLYEPSRWLMFLTRMGPELRGPGRVPEQGPAVLAINHTCYLDPLLVGYLTRRKVHFVTTAEAYRGGLMGWAVGRFRNLPTRRYRTDPVACREMLRRLAEGAVIGIFPESERSVLGHYQGAQCQVASILARLPVPVIPVGLSGAYDVGPRWAGVLRRRRVVGRIGEPVVFNGDDPAAAIDRAILDLIDEPAQRVTLEGLPAERLERAIWRCPVCLDEEGWDAAELSCGSCGTRWSETSDGLFAAGDRGPMPFADLARPVWEAVDDHPFTFHARVSWERSLFGPIRPLEPVFEGPVEVGPDGVGFGDTRIPLDAVREVSTERADSLQLATADELWELRLERGSVFRLQIAVDRWRAAARKRRGTRIPSPPTGGSWPTSGDDEQPTGVSAFRRPASPRPWAFWCPRARCWSGR